MRTVEVLIEKGADRTFGAYVLKTGSLEFGVIGEGNSAQEAKNDFLSVYDHMRKFHEENGVNITPVKFIFKYDPISFLSYYTEAFSLVGLSKVTGIAKGQLSHYINGTSHPSEKTVKKIETSMRQYGRELSEMSLSNCAG